MTFLVLMQPICTIIRSFSSAILSSPHCLSLSLEVCPSSRRKSIYTQRGIFSVRPGYQWQGGVGLPSTLRPWHSWSGIHADQVLDVHDRRPVPVVHCILCPLFHLDIGFAHLVHRKGRQFPFRLWNDRCGGGHRRCQYICRDEYELVSFFKYSLRWGSDWILSVGRL